VNVKFIPLEMILVYSEHRKSLACYLLISLHILLGIGAIFGGGTMILSPDGSILQMPLKMLQHSPFNNFLIPGLILFAVLGVIPLITAIFLFTEKPIKAVEKINIYKNTHWSWNISLYIGFTLIIWITVQMYMIKGIALIHVFYILLGLLIQFITLLPSVKDHYSKVQ
jgi:hypothetical protein